MHRAGGRETHSAGWLWKQRRSLAYITMRDPELPPDSHVFGNVEENQCEQRYGTYTVGVHFAV